MKIGIDGELYNAVPADNGCYALGFDGKSFYNYPIERRFLLNDKDFTLWLAAKLKS